MSKNSLPQDDGSKAIEAIANPPKACPCCYVARGEAFPPTHSTRLCARHAALHIGCAEGLAGYMCEVRNNPSPLWSDAEIIGPMLDTLLMICDTGEEVVFRLAQLALARSETVAYSKGL